MIHIVIAKLVLHTLLMFNLTFHRTLSRFFLIQGSARKSELLKYPYLTGLLNHRLYDQKRHVKDIVAWQNLTKNFMKN